MDSSFFDENELGKDIKPEYSSPRCSKIGYWNDFIPLLDYNSIKEYTQSIRKYSDDGRLKSVSELYYPVRLKPLGENSLENLEHNGVNHIELRMLDLNPLSPVGIMKEDMDFIHLFIIYLMSLQNADFHTQEQILSIKNIKKSAEYNDERIFIQTSENEILPIKEASSEILNNMEKFFSRYTNPNVSEIIKYQKNKVLYKHKRYAEIIKEQFGHNYVAKGIKLAKKYAEEI